ncbi:peptide/nickel transport system ATP-binding protein [Marinobacterium halophilum]|uniref:Peptide/nickel transport system ATP-binding protein n=1 Tax=Marinobacterium halophilum TaxID=267374 RepID=A0A2P8F3D0_9GAMM|nr:ABC transporter ATP-binding protein [Marinobacterium halophilum]PSL16219.1 peptide/nickel transport system ATP-binding protein [Marinobacterium halophilum]
MSELLIMNTTMTPILNVQNLTLGYTNANGRLVSVLRNINLQVAPGEALGLVGESGCGKSTLALAMMAFLRTGSQVQNGSIHFHDQDLFALKPKSLQSLRGGRIGLIPQNAGQSLTPTLKIGAQLHEALHLHSDLPRSQWHQRAIELLQQVRLPSPEAMLDRYPHQLSGGQQQRVAVAMALAGQPELLVLDEPTTGLDVTTQAHILELLRTLRQELGMAMVFVSHDLGAVARVCERIAVMYAGEVIEQGSSREVLLQPTHPYTRALLNAIPRLDTKGLPPSLPGYPPKVGSVTQGCAFASRCSHVQPTCHTDDAPLTNLSAHQVRCHFAGELHNTPATSKVITLPVQRSKEPLLRLEQVQISYHRPGLMDALLHRPAPIATVDGIDLQLKKGETLALVGESGSGKSTIMRAISGIHSARTGEIRLNQDDLNRPVEQRSKALKRRVQMIFQNPDASLNPRHTVFEILQQPLRLYFGLNHDASREKATELLSLVRLAPHYLDRLPGQLSGGEKQRVAIARCFAGDPDLILCDEVTSALDVSVQAAVLKLLKELQQQRGVTYLFIAHDLAVVKAIADQVAVLYQGRLCQVGPVDEVFSGHHHPYTRTLLNAVLEPDPDHQPVIQGEDSPEQHPPARGCAYQRRCSLAEPRCKEQTPPWQQDGNNRIRCHLNLSKLATLIDRPQLIKTANG